MVDKSTQSKVVGVAAMGMQSEAAGVTATGAQTARRTYASVVAQTEDTGEKMYVDGPSGASGGDSGQPAGPATKKPVGDRPVRAFVVHGVACSGPWAHRSREMEKAFGRRGGASLGCGGYRSGVGGGVGHLPRWWCI